MLTPPLKSNQAKHIEQLLLGVNEISLKLVCRAVKDQSTLELDKDRAKAKIYDKPGRNAPIPFLYQISVFQNRF